MRKLCTSITFLIFAFFVFSVPRVSAKVITNQNGEVNVAKNEIVDDDLFIGAQTVQIDGTVNGDVFIGAQTVKITGDINGNVHVGANTIYLGGIVNGNVYAGAQNILVSEANIGGSLLVGAATVNVDQSSVVEGSILAGAGAFSMNSQVGRSVYVGTGNMTLGDNTNIGKDLYYAVGKNKGQENISQSAKIAGMIRKSEINTNQKREQLETAKKSMPAAMSVYKFGSTIISFLGALIIGFLYQKLCNKHLTQTANIVTKSFWKIFGIGFLATIAFIPGVIILCITVIGIPVAGLTFLLFILFAYLSKFVAGLAIGDWMSKKYKWKLSTMKSLGTGLLVIYILKMIPVIGFLTGLVVLWVGLGALTLRVFSKTD
jgi:hypothetical protein